MRDRARAGGDAGISAARPPSAIHRQASSGAEPYDRAVKRWRNLGIAAGAAAAALFAAFDIYQWLAAYASDHFHNDFTFYYAAARIGATHGWQSIYDLDLMQAQLNAMGSGIGVAQLARYISPPPVAWLALPFTLLPYPLAYWIWSSLLLIALAGTWYLAAPGAGRLRLIHLVAALGWVPVIYGLQLGQPGIFVALGVAGSYALLRSGRSFEAGISAYEQRLSFAAGVATNRELTLAPYIGDLTVTRIIQAAIAFWALALVFLICRFRNRSVEWIFVPAIIGGIAASPYLHIDDLVMLGLAGWMYLRISGRPAWSWAFVLAMFIAIEGITAWGPLPLIAGEIAALVLLSVAALKHHDGDAEHQRPEREHDAGFQRDGKHLAVDRQTESLDKRAGPA